jgi:hypothetical protein
MGLFESPVTCEYPFSLLFQKASYGLGFTSLFLLLTLGHASTVIF